MSARNKLNAAYFCGSLLLAGGIGLATQSWQVFAVALAGLLVVNLLAGDIRPPRR
jgi:hypothetical protein